MTLFQWIALPALALLIAADLRGLVRRRQDRGAQIARILVWLSAFIGIAAPSWTSIAARQVGIGRGTDLVIYVFMLGTILVLFRLYAKSFSLQREIVELARRDALRTAQLGGGGGSRFDGAVAASSATSEASTGREGS